MKKYNKNKKYNFFSSNIKSIYSFYSECYCKPDLLIILLFVFLVQVSCAHDYKTEFRNYDLELSHNTTAQLSGSGLQLYLIGAKRELFDSLRLEPGDYTIGIRQTSSRITGVARCKVSAGKKYTIKVIGRKKLKNKSTKLIATCLVINDP